MSVEGRERLKGDARAIFEAAVEGVRPSALLERVDLDEHLDRPLDGYRRVALVGAGKASMAMAGILEAQSGDALGEGLVVVPHGYRATFPAGQPRPKQTEVVEAGHPVPDAAGVQAAQRVLGLTESLGPEDLLLVALSGGGTSLWPAFAGSIALGDARETFHLLLHGGVDVRAANTVRRHLSRIGGGGLARAAHPASVLALVVSDVVGDDLLTIASGPTVPDPTTAADARTVLRQVGLWDEVPASVRDHLSQNEAEQQAGSDRVRTVLVGSNRDALHAAEAEARQRGYAVVRAAKPVTGEARAVGRRLAAEALAVEAARPTCLLWGGETTVTVTGDGRGGRNQEVALAAALALDETDREIIVLSGGTDGIDGPTDAAGAWATPQTLARARTLGLDPTDYLARNDAHPFFDALGQLLRPGPTHTNVMDVQVALVQPASGL